MTNPVVHAFFLGRATADLLKERFEQAVTDFFSSVGKGLTEAQETWRTFPDEVVARAHLQESLTMGESGVGRPDPLPMDDLQATLDDLRAEVAQLRAELKTYRSQST